MLVGRNDTYIGRESACQPVRAVFKKTFNIESLEVDFVTDTPNLALKKAR